MYVSVFPHFDLINLGLYKKKIAVDNGYSNTVVLTLKNPAHPSQAYMP